MSRDSSIIGSALARVSAGYDQSTKPAPYQVCPSQCVVEQQVPGKVTHKPDGTVVWEPLPDRPVRSLKHMASQLAMEFASGCAVATGLCALLAGEWAALSVLVESFGADRTRARLSSSELSAAMAQAMGASMAGVLAGAMLGPLLAVRAVVKEVARPVLALVAVHRGIMWLLRHRSGVTALIKKLQNGDYARQLEALRAIILQAMRSEKFRKEFNKFAGVELLLKMMVDSLRTSLPMDSPLLALLAQALAELTKSNECKDSVVNAGGVAVLVRLLSHGSHQVKSQGLAALTNLAGHPLAQDAIREAGGIGMLVELGGSSNSSTTLVQHSVTLLQALALDPANKAAIGSAGGVDMLLGVIRRAPVKSELQSDAVIALHNLVRGNPDNQRALAAISGSTHALRTSLAGFGPYWHPCKADLHALLNVLARFPSAPCQLPGSSTNELLPAGMPRPADAGDDGGAPAPKAGPASIVRSSSTGSGADSDGSEPTCHHE